MFLGKYNLPKLVLIEIESLNKLITVEEMKRLMSYSTKKQIHKESPSQMVSQRNFTLSLKI